MLPSYKIITVQMAGHASSMMLGVLCLLTALVASMDLDQNRHTKLESLQAQGAVEARRITRKIDMLGSWWANINGDIYSPIASVLKEQSAQHGEQALSMVRSCASRISCRENS